MKEAVRRAGHGILLSLVEAFCADNAWVLEHVDQVHVVERVELYLQGLVPGYYYGLYFALFFIQFAVPPFTWKFLPFTCLSLQRRIHQLEKWEQSRFFFKRVIFIGIKFVCVTQIYSEPRLLVALGYGPALDERTQGKCQSLFPKLSY